MDKMEEWEIPEIYSCLQEADANQWEMTRWLMYAIVQVQSKKKIDLKELLQFPWENESKQHNIEISNNEIARLKEKSQYIMKNMQLD